MQGFDFKRRVTMDGLEYLIEVRRSEPRHTERFETRCYAVVELPRQWQATVPVPDCVTVTAHLWYRELIELVQIARKLVTRRNTAAA